MMWSRLLTTASALLLLVSAATAFAPVVASSRTTSKLYASNVDYDIVKVDLSDGRDYPIYIGAGYSDDEGT